MSKSTILVVDDAEINREFLYEILHISYDIEVAEDGFDALNQLEKFNYNVSAILLDIHMPNMDGIEFLEEFQKREHKKNIPILVITGESDPKVENKCFEFNVADFVRKPFEPYIIINRVKNMIELYSYHNSLEDKIREQTKTLQEQALQLKKQNIGLTDMLATAVEYRSLESGQHIKRVKYFTKVLAERIGINCPEYHLDSQDLELIVLASSLHDIGKIAVPDGILSKPGKLTKEEFECMKTHTTSGCEMLNHLKGLWDDKFMRYAYDICRHHHERYDGKGYPDGLKGEEIPIAAQLVSIADVYDALVSERCYKKGFSKDEAFDMIVGGQCGTFSPKLIKCFYEVRKEMERTLDETVEE